MAELTGDQGIGELLRHLSNDLTLLVRQEVQLAKSELNEKIVRAARDLGSIVIGGAVAFLGGVALVAMLVLLLVQVGGLHAWLAALVVGVVLGALGLALLLGPLRDLRRIEPIPRRTLQTLEDNLKWLKEQP